MYEARVKARLVLNLARFTQWPETAFTNSGDPLILALADRQSVLAQAFAELQGQVVAGHGVGVINNPTVLPRNCHVLFIEADSERRAATLLAAADGQPVLTIGDSDSDGFVQRVTVGLVNVNDTIRFDVNLARLRAAPLNLNSQVLKLARQVRE